MNRDEKIKRLIYQSVHRGCKETDAILGKFAIKYLESFSDEEVQQYEDFILEDDWNIYAWITATVDFPKKHDNKVTRLLRDFDFVGGYSRSKTKTE